MSEANESPALFAQVQEMFQRWQIAYQQVRVHAQADIERNSFLDEATSEALARLTDELQNYLELLWLIMTTETQRVQMLTYRRALYQRQEAIYFAMETPSSRVDHPWGPG